MEDDIRWLQRLDNFDRAYRRLAEVCDGNHEHLSLLEREGCIQRFEYVFELAWKTLRDLLEFYGIQLESVTPRNVIKEAFSAKMLLDGHVWIDMMNDRNLLSHTYSENTFEEAFKRIQARYFPEISALHTFLMKRKAEHGGSGLE